VATEVERKFVVTAVPAADVLGPGARLRQGYLAEEGEVEVRVRIDDSAQTAVLTVKAGKGMSRVEVERSVAVEEADALWPFTSGRRIDKVRHRVVTEGHTADLDIYAGDLDGLFTAEVEFQDEDAAHAFVPPAWFGTEVTGDKRWSNASLARNGRP
jgi:adenylate cyclase